MSYKIQISVFINKDSLEPGYTHLFTYHLQLHSCYNSRTEWLSQIIWLTELKIFSIWPFTEKICWILG